MTGQGRREPLVRLDGVSKRFSRPGSFAGLLGGTSSVTALSRLDLEVMPRERIAVMGPNGSGKTTLLRVISGLVLPDEGKVLAPDASGGVGLVTGDERSFYWRLTARENLAFFAALQGFPPATAAERIIETSRLVEIEDDLDVQFRALSAGKRSRLGLARALITGPRLLLLDEPTRSVDLKTKPRIWEAIADLSSRLGAAIIMATHDPEEAGAIADRWAILKAGVLGEFRGPSSGSEIAGIYRSEA